MTASRKYSDLLNEVPDQKPVVSEEALAFLRSTPTLDEPHVCRFTSKPCEECTAVEQVEDSLDYWECSTCKSLLARVDGLPVHEEEDKAAKCTRNVLTWATVEIKPWSEVMYTRVAHDDEVADQVGSCCHRDPSDPMACADAVSRRD